MSKNAVKSTLSLEEQIAAQKAQLEALLEKKKNEERARIDAIAAQIDGLPKTFGVDNLEGVLNLIRQRVKGTLGAIESGITRQRTVVSPETKAKILERVKAGGPGNQRSQICAEFGIHPQTLQNWLSDAGMVNKRNATATAPESTVGAQTATAATVAA